MTEPTKPAPTDESAARQKRRSIALGLVLTGLVVIFYVLTIIKMAPNNLHGS
jgi:hypothetical protein